MLPFLSAASGVLILLLAMIVYSDADQGPTSVERRVWAMGTHLTVSVEAAHRGAALAASEAALRAVAEVEERLSTWTDGSELSRLNSAVFGSAVPISPELEGDLRAASVWWRVTRGAFDPGIASLVRAWDLRGDGRQPTDAELEWALANSGLAHLDLCPGFARVKASGFGIEEGGFGKGIALQRALDSGLASGADCVVMDFGGQVALGGACRKIEVGIADPDLRDKKIATLSLQSGSVATSGNSERGIVADGERRGHLLDPRTGVPAPDWGAVTVVAADPVVADCLSTALYIMGPWAGGEWLQDWPEIEAVFVERSRKDAKITVTSGLKGRLIGTAGKLTYLRQGKRPETTQ
jgi:thiamine biosynthesis lipoprotein